MSFFFHACRPSAAVVSNYSIGKGWALDGNNDHIESAANAALGISDNLSTEAIIRVSSSHSGAAVICGRKPSSGHNWFWLLDNAGNGYIEFLVKDGLGGNKQYRIEQDFRDDTTHQIGATFAAGTLTIFLDGAEATVTKVSDDSFSAIDTTSYTFVIGANPNGGAAAEMVIGRCAVWDTAVLSESEFSELWSSGTPTDPASNHGNYSSSGDLVLLHDIQSTDSTASDGVLDTSGNSIHASTTNMVAGDLVDFTYSLDKSWDLNGSNQYIEVGYDASLNITSNYSCEVVFNCTAADTGANQFLASRRISGGLVYQMYVVDSTGYLTVYCHDGTNARQLTYQTDITGANHQAGFTVASGNQTVILDGVDITGSCVVDINNAITGLRSNTSDAFRTGAIESAGAPFKGKIGRCCIWDTSVLTAAEYLTLYDSGSFGVDPTYNSGNYTSSADLVMALLMKTGDAVGSDGVIDSSENGNHGTTQNLASEDLVDW